ncbi:MAG: arabinan endo-1,5-alpha-L-arabinosidase [Bacteroidota bacterium]
MKKYLSILGSVAFTGLAIFSLPSCKKKDIVGPGGVDTTVVVVPPFDINSINDTYADVAPFSFYLKWGSYNVHDPSVKKFGDTYYCYGTDVGFGTAVPAGIQVRKSKDLIEWKFVNWAFNGVPAMGKQFITTSGGTAFEALWAPYVLKVGSEYRMYYSLSCAVARLSVIGLATSSSPEGPWVEKGLVVVSKNDAAIQTNAIDPTVITTPAGEQYFYYGSAWDGIYMLKLDPATGLAAVNGDKGVRVANRGFTAGKYNGNIEGAEIIYNPALNKYYLFIAYDWLQTKYNVRVCRSDNPQGPFLDYNGVNANTNIDHGPMILAPYQFMGHGGWQGVSHPGVFDDGAGNYFMAHQGRPAVNSFYMDLHIRKIFWTTDGWPVVSPERYANVTQASIPQSDLVGDWEQIIMGYNIVPGYGNEQTNPDMQVAATIILNAGGTINGVAANTWTYTEPTLTLKYSNGFTDKVIVSRERDWENKKTSTLVFTGLNNAGTAIWGKKK